jgi:hypothetical protein
MRSKLLVPAVALFFVSAPLYTREVEIAQSWGDYSFHMEVARNILHGRADRPHLLLHVTLLALTGGTIGTAAPGALAMLLALSVAVRTWMTAGYLNDSRKLSAAALTILCLSIAFAAPLPNWWHGDLIVGQPSANAWHSPTYVFASAFCLWLFLDGLRLLARPSPGGAAVVGLAMVLSLLAKPNYVLAFAPIFGLALCAALWRAWRGDQVNVRRVASILALAFLPTLVAIGGQAAWLRSEHPVFLAPWVVWGIHSPNIPASILLGTAFPLVVLVLFPRAANSDRPLVLAWCTFAVGVATFALMAESNLGEANWGWGMHLADLVLFVASTAFVIRQPARLRQAVCLAVLGLHAVSGAVYLAGRYAS